MGGQASASLGWRHQEKPTLLTPSLQTVGDNISVFVPPDLSLSLCSSNPGPLVHRQSPNSCAWFVQK